MAAKSKADVGSTAAKYRPEKKTKSAPNRKRRPAKKPMRGQGRP